MGTQEKSSNKQGVHYIYIYIKRKKGKGEVVMVFRVLDS